MKTAGRATDITSALAASLAALLLTGCGEDGRTVGERLTATEPAQANVQAAVQPVAVPANYAALSELDWDGTGAWFQYKHLVPYTHRDKERTAEIFCWLPPQAPAIRGLLVGGNTLAETDISIDPLMRVVLAQEGIGSVYAKSGLGFIDLAALMDEFAKKSGYDELRYAPMFFHGHSAGGPAAKRLAIKHAERCFGLMQYRGGVPLWKNGETGEISEVVPNGIPALAMVGQFDEFGGVMRREDGFEGAWMRGRDDVRVARHADQNRLYAYAVEPGAGHFTWSERNAPILARFVAEAARLRIPAQWDPTAGQAPALNAVPATAGVLLPLDLHDTSIPPQQVGSYTGDPREAMWVTSSAMAEHLLAYHADLIGLKDQFLGWNDRYWVDAGTRFFFMGLKMAGPDSFTVSPKRLDTYPGQHDGKGPIWLEVGQPVSHSEQPIQLRVVAGPAVVVDNQTLRFQHNALVPVGERSRLTFMAYVESGGGYRHTEQVGMAPRGFKGNTKGSSQQITVQPLPETIPVSGEPIALQMEADSGLPVQAYVAEGPAIIKDGMLHIVDVPQRAVFPITLKITAYQLGSGQKPFFKAAEPVQLTVQLTK